MLLGQDCSMLSTILFSIVTPDCGLIQAQQYCSILLTTRNNVAPTTLLHPVFNNLLQLIIFCRVPNEFPSYSTRVQGGYGKKLLCQQDLGKGLDIRYNIILCLVMRCFLVVKSFTSLVSVSLSDRFLFVLSSMFV